MRLAFVVQRFGEEVAGGAEALCRSTARALAGGGDEVDVYTTTARDYLTWRPHYREGVERDGPVVVRRFAADAPDPRRSAALVRSLALGDGGPEAERDWALAQGPLAPGLVRALGDAASRYEAVALWTYLYATTQLAVGLARDRSILVPLAHDEPMLRFGITRGVVRAAAGLAFMTPEERRLVDDLHGLRDRPEAIVGAALDPAPPGDGVRARAGRPGLPRRFALYMGRVDPAKGVDALVRAHEGYRSAGGPLGLVLAGRPAGRMRLPRWVVATGFVDARARSDLLDAAEVVVLPSPHESLSLVALEAWRAGRPTLATARSEVLSGQSARSGGGLLYDDAASYARQLSRLASDGDLRDRLGARGARFCASQTWDACARRWRALLARVRRPLSPSSGSA
jgi:glycosyltransferase involved in cell wall biosynthesis